MVDLATLGLSIAYQDVRRDVNCEMGHVDVFNVDAEGPMVTCEPVAAVETGICSVMTSILPSANQVASMLDAVMPSAPEIDLSLPTAPTAEK